MYRFQYKFRRIYSTKIPVLIFFECPFFILNQKKRRRRNFWKSHHHLTFFHTTSLCSSLMKPIWKGKASFIWNFNLRSIIHLVHFKRYLLLRSNSIRDKWKSIKKRFSEKFYSKALKLRVSHSYVLLYKFR